MAHTTHSARKESGKEIDSIPTERQAAVVIPYSLSQWMLKKRNEHYDYEIFKAIFQQAASNNKCAAQFITVVGNVNKAFSKRKQTHTLHV